MFYAGGLTGTTAGDQPGTGQDFWQLGALSEVLTSRYAGALTAGYLVTYFF